MSDARCLADRCGCEARFFKWNQQDKIFQDYSRMCHVSNHLTKVQRFIVEDQESDEPTTDSKNLVEVYRSFTSLTVELMLDIGRYLQDLMKTDPSQKNVEKLRRVGNILNALQPSTRSAPIAEDEDASHGEMNHDDDLEADGTEDELTEKTGGWKNKGRVHGGGKYVKEVYIRKRVKFGKGGRRSHGGGSSESSGGQSQSWGNSGIRHGGKSHRHRGGSEESGSESWGHSGVRHGGTGQRHRGGSSGYGGSESESWGKSKVRYGGKGHRHHGGSEESGSESSGNFRNRHEGEGQRHHAGSSGYGGSESGSWDKSKDRFGGEGERHHGGSSKSSSSESFKKVKKFSSYRKSSKKFGEESEDEVQERKWTDWLKKGFEAVKTILDEGTISLNSTRADEAAEEHRILPWLIGKVIEKITSDEGNFADEIRSGKVAISDKEVRNKLASMADSLDE